MTQPLVMVRRFWRPRQGGYSPTPSRGGADADIGKMSDVLGPGPPVDPNDPLANWPAIGYDITWVAIGTRPMPVLVVPNDTVVLNS